MAVQTGEAAKMCAVCGGLVRGSAKEGEGPDLKSYGLTCFEHDHSAIQCTECGALVCRKCEIKTHMKNAFFGYDRLTCPLCSQRFKLKTIVVREDYDPKAVFLSHGKGDIVGGLAYFAIQTGIAVVLAVVGVLLFRLDSEVATIIGLILIGLAIWHWWSTSPLNALLGAVDAANPANRFKIRCPSCKETNRLQRFLLVSKCEWCEASIVLPTSHVKHVKGTLDSDARCSKCGTMNPPFSQRPAYFECSYCREVITLEKLPAVQSGSVMPPVARSASAPLPAPSTPLAMTTAAPPPGSAAPAAARPAADHHLPVTSATSTGHVTAQPLTPAAPPVECPAADQPPTPSAVPVARVAVPSPPPGPAVSPAARPAVIQPRALAWLLGGLGAVACICVALACGCQGLPIMMGMLSGASQAPVALPTLDVPAVASTVHPDLTPFPTAQPTRAPTTAPALSLETDRIAVRAPMPTLRTWACSAAENGRFYLLGGLTFEESTFSNRLEVYDVSTDRWETLADVPVARMMAASVLLDGKIYVFGGVGVDGVVTQIDVYDISENRWNSVGEMPYEAWDLMAEAWNGKIYLIGGVSGITDKELLDSVYVYDPMLGSWEAGPSLLSPRHGAASAVVDGKIYIIGGKEGSGSTSFPTDRVEALDTSVMAWETLASMERARMGMRGTVVNGKIYVAGGAVGNDVLNSIDCYDPATGLWTRYVLMTMPRSMAEIEASENVLFVAGGVQNAPADVADMEFTDMLEVVRVEE